MTTFYDSSLKKKSSWAKKYVISMVLLYMFDIFSLR